MTQRLHISIECVCVRRSRVFTCVTFGGIPQKACHTFRLHFLNFCSRAFSFFFSLRVVVALSAFCISLDWMYVFAFSNWWLKSLSFSRAICSTKFLSSNSLFLNLYIFISSSALLTCICSTFHCSPLKALLNSGVWLLRCWQIWVVSLKPWSELLIFYIVHHRSLWIGAWDS